jgi:Fur family transcriptional regulator, ferric uptake regulator
MDKHDLMRAAFGGGRASSQRLAIAAATAAESGAFTADDLAASARAEDPRIGLATVYRSIAAMLASGWLERVGTRDGHALYLRCTAGEHHHHHLVCTSCGRVEETPCPLGDVALERAARAGFVVTRHEVNVYGLCRSCLGGDGPATRTDAEP